jgi:hypothetical protein
LIFAPDVKWPPDMHERIVAAVPVIDAVHRDMTGSDATCTSAYRSQTPGGSSLHPFKRALDLRTWAFGDPSTEKGKKRVREFAKRLREKLGPDYDVVVEGPAAEKAHYLKRPQHVHLEYDPKPPKPVPQPDGAP